MKDMACKLILPFKSHPWIVCFILLLFTPPIFPMVMFFWPLIVSTALGVLAVISFGQQGEHTADYTQSSVCAEDICAGYSSFPAQEEKTSNVLMVDNQEVTWLEWLHHEDTQKFCAHERVHCMSAVWDADGCDVSSFVAGETFVDADAMKVDDICEAVVDADASKVEDTGIVCANRSIAEDVTCVRTVETRVVVRAAVADLDGIRIKEVTAVNRDEEKTKMDVLSLIAEDASKWNALDMTAEEEMKGSSLGLMGADDEDMGGTKKNANILTAEDELRANSLHMTAEDETKGLCCDGRNTAGLHYRNAVGSSANDEAVEDMRKRNDLDSTVKIVTDVNTCVDGDEGQSHMDRLFLTGEGKSVESALVSGVVDAHMTSVSLLGLMSGDKSKMNDCAFTSGNEGGTTLNALLSTSKTESRGNEPQLSSPNMIVSVMLERKAAEGHGVHHIDDQGQEERGLKESNEHDLQREVSDDAEENMSSLRFSFFHNGCLIPTPLNKEAEECGQADKGISLAAGATL